MKNIFIIGAGPSGLITARELLKKDFKVTILEKSNYIGGMCRSWKEDNYLLDTGPHIYHTPDNVSDPKRYGVVEFDNQFNIKSLEEKPIKPKSNYAISGIYIFDKNVYEIAKNLKPTDRGETEIIDILIHYLKKENLKLEILNRGVSWFDTGTHKSLLEASVFVEVLESRQGLKIACIEEICFQKGYINKSDLINLAMPMKNSSYGEYLLKIANSK